MDVRPSVQRFAQRMEQKLRAHDADRGEQGWLDGTDPFWFVQRIREETDELEKAMREGRGYDAEAADVANLAMMASESLTAQVQEERLEQASE